MLGNESGNYEGGKWEDYMNGAKSLLDGFEVKTKTKLNLSL